MDNISDAELDAAATELHHSIEHSRLMITHADTKASLLAAGTIPLAVLLLAAPSLTGPSGAASVFAWIGAVFALSGIGCLGTVVWPRLPAGDTGIRASAHRSAERIAAHAVEAARDPERMLRANAKQLAVLSALALIKFRLLRAAMSCFGVAAVFMIAAAIAWGLR
ncbi:Pycsar system effector family protein [Glycomyces sp. NPDC046736]|uniref:Pycsar system effector family protein n=1 Tax=Glycomyces sp. NPDC046736 TaxID=3155615 RepID=UPI0033FBFDEB